MVKYISLHTPNFSPCQSSCLWRLWASVSPAAAESWKYHCLSVFVLPQCSADSALSLICKAKANFYPSKRKLYRIFLLLPSCCLLQCLVLSAWPGVAAAAQLCKSRVWKEIPGDPFHSWYSNERNTACKASQDETSSGLLGSCD